jgi:hypothetical protein
MYCAIIGDIIDSRKIIDERSEVQERFKTVIHSINQNYSQTIVSNFTITNGDGFYGLLNSPIDLLNIILEIRLALVPHQIRMGIGFGGIGTKIEKYESYLVDGRANSTAKEAIDNISENKGKYQAVYRTTLLKVDSIVYDQLAETDGKAVNVIRMYENLINTIFCGCASLEKTWNTIQANTIKWKTDQYTQREIGDKLGISQPAVQKRLTSAGFYLYEYYQEMIKSGIEALWKEVQHA